MLHKTVVLVGMMGAGKTAVGRTLAAQLGVGFHDSDHEIESAANLSVAEIFSRYGEAFFRAREHDFLKRLLEGAPGILSTGGGAFMSAQNREMISELGVSVWIDANVDLLWERVRHKTTRPLLQTDDPYGTLKALHEARVGIYAKADLRVVSEAGLSLEHMAQKTARALLEARPDILEGL